MPAERDCEVIVRAKSPAGHCGRIWN